MPRHRHAWTRLSKTIVCDSLAANTDQHENNLGVLRDIETLEWTGVTPISDNGRGFFHTEKTEGKLADGLFFYQSNPFEERPCASFPWQRT